MLEAVHEEGNAAMRDAVVFECLRTGDHATFSERRLPIEVRTSSWPQISSLSPGILVATW